MKYNFSDKYEVIVDKRIKELNADSYILRHKKSGARVFVVSNEDENKVFNIGFRTPVSDSTGVPHIMEHTVLCGSDKFNVKDPFVELVKGSLNTFLNAMTYNDKTVYPVASCNDQDFQNLMDVYLDAVLHPNIYKDIRIFKQEGWHYELEQKEGPLTINGVVYNEMKGVFSSADSVLDSEIMSALYPDITYGQDSGGNPVHIPELTYEQYLDFHRGHYHPSNSYIYLYGNMDAAEKLDFIDREYLCHYDAIEIDTEIRAQAPFDEIKEKEGFYSIGEDEEEADRTYLAYARVCGDNLDPKRYVGLQVLDYVLLGSPGAPLKQALIDAGIGTDILGGYDSGIYQPNFTVIAKNTEKDKKEEFLSVIDKVLCELSENGINKRSIQSGINYFEFKFRESDFGSYPKGLIYGLNCFDSWLYKENDPYMHLEFEETFEALKKEMNEGYFENLIRTYLLENKHGVTVVLSPKKGLATEEEAKQAKELEKILEAMTEEEKEALIEETKDLKDYQEEPSPREELEKIPMLSREDIKKEVTGTHFTEKQVTGMPVLHSDIFTSGITYLRVLFNASDIKEEDLSAFAFFKAVLGSLSTKEHSYLELFNEINIETGGINTTLANYGIYKKPTEFRQAFEFSAKVFSPKVEKAFEFIHEIMYETIFDDEKRLHELAARFRSRYKERMVTSGHTAAVVRCGSYHSPSARSVDKTSGIDYYEYLSRLEKNFDEEKDALIAKLKEFAAKLFTKERMFVSCTADAEGYAAFEKAYKAFLQNVKEGESFRSGMTGHEILKTYDVSGVALEQKNEGFKAASQIQYVARCGSFRKAGYEYTGALKILQTILSYEYLWTQVRIMGGAYGVMSGFGKDGDSYFVSYRDPNLSKTNEAFEGVPSYVAEFGADEREMTKYIIGTISGMDTPMNPNASGNRDLSLYVSETPLSELQKERDQVLTASEAEIRALAPITKAILEAGNICVIGNDNKIEQESELFREIKRLS